MILVKRFFISALAGLALAGGALTGTAVAAESPQNANTGTTQYAGMTVVGFDQQVAAAHGYVIRTGADGRQYAVKAGQLTPDSSGGNYVTGDCGWSWVQVNGTGNRGIRLDSGFGVIRNVIAWEWHDVLIDRGGVSRQDWNPRPGPGTPQLRFGRNLPNLTVGPITAEVQSNSKVTLDNGAICSSAVHADHGTVY
jgi:hypothetical protein